MILALLASRKPRRQVIPMDKLHQLLHHALQNAWDPSTKMAYQSHLNSYADFILLHCIDFEPNPLTLSLFIVFMSQHIKPTSVEGYLTGIIHSLLPLYPKILDWRTSLMVRQTLCGCKKSYNTAVLRKRPLSMTDLNHVANIYITHRSYDDLLFLAQLLVGFYGLLCLGELCYLDSPNLNRPTKMTARESLQISPSSLEFLLPYHKADHYFEGNKVLILANPSSTDSIAAMYHYLNHRNIKFPKHHDLWIRSDGKRPCHSWFLKRLRKFFDKDTAGQSIRSGGATALAEHGVRLDIIQAMGHWASNTFLIYIRNTPSFSMPPFPNQNHSLC